MRTVTISRLLVLFMFLILVYSLMVTHFNINPETLPWISIEMLAMVLAIVVEKFGDRLLPILLDKLGVKYSIGDAYIEGKYIIIKNYDYTSPDEAVAGMSVLKLVPLSPASELEKEEQFQLLRNIESSIASLPEGVEFCIKRTKSDFVEAKIKEIEREKKKIEAKMNLRRHSAGTMKSLEQQLALLDKELERLRVHSPVTGSIYLKIFAYGPDDEEVKRKLDAKIKQVKSFAHLINTSARELKESELHEFIMSEAVGHSLIFVQA